MAQYREKALSESLNLIKYNQCHDWVVIVTLGETIHANTACTTIKSLVSVGTFSQNFEGSIGYVNITLTSVVPLLLNKIYCHAYYLRNKNEKQCIIALIKNLLELLCYN